MRQAARFPTGAQWPAIAMAAAAVFSLASCKPEISGNTYFCGPDSLCPPNLVCQLGGTESFTYSCVLPGEADSFACPVPSADQEPDDSPAQARDLGDIACGEQVQFQNWGCIEDGEDIDTFRFTRPTDCNAVAPRVKATLRFPLGAAPLALELRDESGEVLSTGETCTSEQDNSGTEQVCVDHPNSPIGTYTLHVVLDADGNADCDGNCRFNRYQLVIISPQG
ncbi:MAG: hypothetical protein GY811_28595 [Myxococcales bacterium]|nr:hypothetical protein [Myxococcales bacterium]